jgi:hypothetical protein
MANGKLSAKEQLAIVQGVSEALSEGFSSGLAEANAKATEEQRGWLNSFTAHMLARHAYPHKSGLVLCDVFFMQEDQHGRAQQRFMA